MEATASQIDYPNLPANAAELETTLSAQLTEVAAHVEGLVIRTNADFTAAAELLRDQVVPLRKLIIDSLAKPKAAALSVHRWFTGMERRLLDRVPEAPLKAKIAAYSDEQDRLRAEAEAEAQRAAEAAAEADKMRLAEIAMDCGDLEQAERIMEAPSVPVMAAPIAMPAPAKVTGVASAETWSAEVTDLAALIRWAAQSPADRAQYLTPCQPALNGLARRLKGAMAVPGVQAVCQRGVRVGPIR